MGVGGGQLGFGSSRNQKRDRQTLADSVTGQTASPNSVSCGASARELPRSRPKHTSQMLTGPVPDEVLDHPTVTEGWVYENMAAIM